MCTCEKDKRTPCKKCGTNNKTMQPQQQQASAMRWRKPLPIVRLLTLYDITSRQLPALSAKEKARSHQGQSPIGGTPEGRKAAGQDPTGTAHKGQEAQGRGKQFPLPSRVLKKTKLKGSGRKRKTRSQNETQSQGGFNHGYE